MLGEASGGHRGTVVDYVTLFGVARADVGRVDELQNGETVELPLNRWRGFGYSTTTARSDLVPRASGLRRHAANRSAPSV